MPNEAFGLGEHGEIEAVPQKRDANGRWVRAAQQRSATRWRARVHFRGFNGVPGEISKFGKTRAMAVERVEEALKEESSLNVGMEGMTPSMPFVEAGELWLEQIKRPGPNKLADSSIDDYERAFNNHVKGEKSTVRGLSLKQVNNPQRLRLFLQDVADRHGTGSAKTTRAVVAGILWMAVENGLFDTNAIKMVRPIESKKPKRTQRRKQHDLKRAFTVEEADAVMAYADKLALDEERDPRTVRKWQSTADLNAYMKGTGARISEARELFWDEVDLLTGWTYVYGTKTGGSVRAVKMPMWLLLRLRRRGARNGTEGRVFPSPHQISDPYKPWDQSNCNKAVRKVLDGAKMLWAVPHTWRRTVATRLKNAKWDPAKIADQLGHVDPSMTMDNYFERDLMARADPGAAELL